MFLFWEQTLFPLLCYGRPPYSKHILVLGSSYGCLWDFYINSMPSWWACSFPFRDGVRGIFCFFPPSSQFVPPPSSQMLPEMFLITHRFYSLCFARRSTPFNINYNPRLHVYFYFAIGAAKRCFLSWVLHVPE
jgi:hypothetical protein